MVAFTNLTQATYNSPKFLPCRPLSWKSHSRCHLRGRILLPQKLWVGGLDVARLHKVFDLYALLHPVLQKVLRNFLHRLKYGEMTRIIHSCSLIVHHGNVFYLERKVLQLLDLNARVRLLRGFPLEPTPEQFYRRKLAVERRQSKDLHHSVLRNFVNHVALELLFLPSGMLTNILQHRSLGLRHVEGDVVLLQEQCQHFLRIR